MIQEPEAWRYNEYAKPETWFDMETLELACGPLYLDRSAKKAAVVLTMTESDSAIKRIKDIIVEGLPDLCAMPCQRESKLEGKKYGELKVMANGTQIGGDDIRVENEVPSYA